MGVARNGAEDLFSRYQRPRERFTGLNPVGDVRTDVVPRKTAEDLFVRARAAKNEIKTLPTDRKRFGSTAR